MTEGIQLEGVTKTYRRGGEELRVLDGLDLHMDEGHFYALMGPSGSGKTTLLNLVGGLDRPDTGRVVVAGEDVGQLTGDALSEWRARSVGFVFQGFNLVPVLSALENVRLPLTLTPLTRKQQDEHARFALEVVGLADRAGHRPQQLSGGQEQHARSSQIRACCSATSRPGTSTVRQPTGCWTCSSA